MYYISHCIPHSPPRPHTIAFGTYPYDSLSKLGLRSSRPLPTQVKRTWKNQITLTPDKIYKTQIQCQWEKVPNKNFILHAPN